MEKYTSLERALQDQSLVIITEDIKTRGELNKVYAKYRVLSAQKKRYSDYYSNEFLGYTVPEMYVLIKDGLPTELGVVDNIKNIELAGSKYTVTEPDLYYKEDCFNAGDTNLCFILGHSGSGKSWMASALEGDDIDHIELDDLLLVKDHFTMDELQGYSDMIYDYFCGEGARYYIGIEERNELPKEEYEDKLFIDFVNYAMAYAKSHSDRKYIIEGIWIYLYFDDPSVFEDYAVFIKGTSFLKSKIRATKRELQRDREELVDRKQMFGREVRPYLLDEDKIDRYRDYYGQSPYTIFREEESDADKQNVFVREELIRINCCFVDDDANGIVAIKRSTQANDELATTNRIRIVRECNAALLEL